MAGMVANVSKGDDDAKTDHFFNTIVEIIEMPRLPLEKTNMSKIMLGLICVFVGVFFSVNIFVLYPYFKLTYLT